MSHKPGSVAIAYCHADSVEGVFAESLVRLLLFDANGEKRVVGGGGVISMASGPLIAAARNNLVKSFLASDLAEWLFMVDSDMVFPPDVLERLLEAADPVESPVVAGLCFAGGRSGQIVPTLYKILDKGDGVGKGSLGVIQDWPEGEVLTVDATGAACILIHRSLLAEMGARWDGPSPWFFTGVHGGTEYGEDFGFCVRVAALGKPIRVHTGVSIGHSKRHIYDHEDFAAYKARRATVGEEGIIADRTAKLRIHPHDPAPSNVIPINRAERRRRKREQNRNPVPVA